MKTKVSYTGMILVLLAIAGCSPQQTTESVVPVNSSSSSSANTSLLTSTQVLAIADAETVKMGYDLQFYPKFDQNRKPFYDPVDRSWRVYYSRRPNRHTGDEFSITVCDKTRATKFFGGK